MSSGHIDTLGMIHDFWLIAAIANLTIASAAGITWHLLSLNQEGQNYKVRRSQENSMTR